MCVLRFMYFVYWIPENTKPQNHARSQPRKSHAMASNKSSDDMAKWRSITCVWNCTATACDMLLHFLNVRREEWWRPGKEHNTTKKNTEQHIKANHTKHTDINTNIILRIRKQSPLLQRPWNIMNTIPITRIIMLISRSIVRVRRVRVLRIFLIDRSSQRPLCDNQLTIHNDRSSQRP